jgi:hypothetical protein
MIVGERVFGIPSCVSSTDPRLAAAITNGTAPGLYVREGDDTSNWEVYREVLARRVEEALASRRGGEGGVGAGDETATETATTVRRFGPGPCMCSTNGLFIGVTVPYHIEWSGTAMFYVYSDGRREQTETTLEHCLNSVRSGSYVELPVGGVTPGVQATPTATRRDDEIRVGDVVEVVSCRGGNTVPDDIGCGGCVDSIRGTTYVRLSRIEGMRLPDENIASLVDVRKVSSPPQTVAVTVSPMSDGEAARIEAAVTDEARRSVSSPLASSSDETTRRRVVNPVPPAVSVSLRPHDFTAAAITNYLQSLGATHTHINQVPGRLLMVEVTGLSQQAFDTARQNLPVGIQLRAAGGVVGRRDSGGTTAARGVQSETPAAASPPPTPSRFSLLEVDLPPEPTSSNSRSLDADLAALQEELRVERERNRAQAAAQMQKSRFDLLECDLPAVPVAAVPAVAAKPVKSPRPIVSSSPPPRPRNPVETITDLTAARSPLELARMLERLNDELSTMMRQREAN